MNLLYFDCSSGASGDMILGALLDAGAPEAELRATLAELDLQGWDLEVTKVARAGIHATRAIVHVKDDHPARRYRDIVAIINAASVPEAVSQRSLSIFETLAEAEAHVHGCSREDVHFHELGAVDALIDVVGASSALELLRPERIVTSPIATGTGRVRTAHGELPLPAPAVAEILGRRGAPVYGRGRDELITPTGAAILATVSDSFGDMPLMQLRHTGYGAGSRDGAVANVVRVIVGEPEPVQVQASDAVLLETNIDDMSPELLPRVLELLLSAGAHDAWLTPIVMKKGRAAFTLSALVDTARKDGCMDIIYRETTTFGIRVVAAAKQTLEREWVEVAVQGRPLRIKLARSGDEIVTRAPEYEDALEISKTTGLALKEVYRLALEALEADGKPQGYPNADPARSLT